MDKKVKAVRELYEREVSIRSKSDKIRWEAYNLVGHRLKELSACNDCPVPELRPYSSEGTKAIDTLVKGLMSAMMSPNSRWFGCTVVPRKYVQGQSPVDDMEYTSYVVKSMMNEFSHSNVYAESEMTAKDSVIGGYSCLFIREDDKGITNFQTLIPWRCWFDTDMFGNPNAFFYRYTLDGYQMLERFPDMDEEKRRQCSRNPSGQKFDMLFAVVDRKMMFDEDGSSLIFSKNMKYAALQISLNDDTIIEESGYRDFPVVIHVWEKDSDSHYGTGLVMKYISEFRKLRKLGLELGISIEYINHPSFNVPKSMEDSFSDDPRSRNVYVTTDQIATITKAPPDLNSMQNAYLLQVDVIRRICFNDYMNFLTTHDQVYTATQVNQIKSESLAQIAPISNNINVQKLQPILKHTYTNMINNGRLSMPDKGVMAELDENGDRKNVIKFTFVSSISEQLSMYSQLNAIDSTAERLMAWVNITGDQNLADKCFRISNILKLAARASGGDTDIIKTEAETKAVEDRIEQERQQMMALEMQKMESEANRNNAGASNLNNIQGMNGGMQ